MTYIVYISDLRVGSSSGHWAEISSAHRRGGSSVENWADPVPASKMAATAIMATSSNSFCVRIVVLYLELME